MSESARSSTWRAGVRVALPILVICVGLGALMGIAWNLLAPRTELTVKDGSVVYARVTEASVGADLTFACLGIGCGLLVSAFIAVKWRSGGVELPIVAVIGGVIGSVIAWRIGLVLAGNSAGTGTADLSAAGRAEGVAFEGPLSLDSPGALGMWSLASAIVLLLVFWRRASAASRRVDAVLVQSSYLQSVEAQRYES